MSTHLLAAGFKILSEADSTLESHSWLKERAEAPKPDKRLLVTIQLLFGAGPRGNDKEPTPGLHECRMLTCSLICEA